MAGPVVSRRRSSSRSPSRRGVKRERSVEKVACEEDDDPEQKRRNVGQEESVAGDLDLSFLNPELESVVRGSTDIRTSPARMGGVAGLKKPSIVMDL